MVPDRAQEEVKGLVGRNVAVQLIENSGQCYALITGLESPCPPWGANRHDILIVIPAAYDAAELDGFYVGLPYSFNGGEHNRVNGNIVELLGRKWKQVSWHYPEGKPWRRGQDNLETHIFHCSGFFVGRGAVNAR